MEKKLNQSFDQHQPVDRPDPKLIKGRISGWLVVVFLDTELVKIINFNNSFFQGVSVLITKLTGQEIVCKNLSKFVVDFRNIEQRCKVQPDVQEIKGMHQDPTGGHLDHSSGNELKDSEHIVEKSIGLGFKIISVLEHFDLVVFVAGLPNKNDKGKQSCDIVMGVNRFGICCEKGHNRVLCINLNGRYEYECQQNQESDLFLFSVNGRSIFDSVI